MFQFREICDADLGTLKSTFAFYQATSILGLLLAKGAQGFFSSLMWVAGMSLCFDAGDLEKFGTTVGTVSLIHEPWWWGPYFPGIIPF